jgi:hypothetical protein
VAAPVGLPIVSYTNFSIDITPDVRIHSPQPRLRGQDVLMRWWPTAAVKQVGTGHEDQHVHRARAVSGHDVPARAGHYVPEARHRDMYIQEVRVSCLIFKF